MADIPGNSTTTTTFNGEPSFGSSISGTYDFFGDTDWIKVTLSAGITYNFFASAETYGQYGGDSVLYLYNASSTQVASDDDGGTGFNSLISYTPSASGVFYLSVRTFSGDPGDYTVSATALTAVNKELTNAADTYTGIANERIMGGKGDDVITIGAGLHALGEQGNDSIIGNAFNNFITGGAGNDTLQGAAGNDTVYGDSGNDYILGGIGDDKLYGGLGSDRIEETSGTNSIWGEDGADYLSGGSDVDNIAGGTGDDRIFGNGGNDLLNGNQGNDQVYGGLGDDKVLVDSALDQVIESVGQGTNDWVLASVNYTLTAGSEIELLSTNSVAGTNAQNLGGNELAQRINGNNGNNIIYGYGGADILVGYGGNDNLEGGAGNDTLHGVTGIDKFVFRQAGLATGGVDHIVDFGADDFIYFDVTSGPTGTLAASALRSGQNALDADDRFMYDIATGNLYFDPDGNGATAKTLIAVLDNTFALGASDIVLF